MSPIRPLRKVSSGSQETWLFSCYCSPVCSFYGLCVYPFDGTLVPLIAALWLLDLFVEGAYCVARCIASGSDGMGWAYQSVSQTAADSLRGGFRHRGSQDVMMQWQPGVADVASLKKLSTGEMRVMAIIVSATVRNWSGAKCLWRWQAGNATCAREKTESGEGESIVTCEDWGRGISGPRNGSPFHLFLYYLFTDSFFGVCERTTDSFSLFCMKPLSELHKSCL